MLIVSVPPPITTFASPELSPRTPLNAVGSRGVWRHFILRTLRKHSHHVTEHVYCRSVTASEPAIEQAINRERFCLRQQFLLDFEQRGLLQRLDIGQTRELSSLNGRQIDVYGHVHRISPNSGSSLPGYIGSTRVADPEASPIRALPVASELALFRSGVKVPNGHRPV
jgi:hypothetical protein